MISFKLFGVYVHIRMSFWVGILLWGALLTGCRPHPVGLLYFAVAGFAVIFLHELGHAVVGRALINKHMELFLTFLGGRTCTRPDAEDVSPRRVILTLLAGPMVGILMLAGMWLGMYALEGSAEGALRLGVRMLHGELPMEYIGSCPMLLLLTAVYLLQITVVWTMLNVVPLLPMDGGLVLFELMEGRKRVPHAVSMVCALLLAVVFFGLGVWGVALLLLLLAHYNYRCMLSAED